MKKSVIVLSSLAATMIATAALAAPADRKGPDTRHHDKGRRGPHIEQQKRNNLNIPADAPEEIKAMYKEFYSLNHDLRLELNKENPDGVKALEMVYKAEDLHKSLRQWKVGQILEGKMPKPELTPRGGRPYGSAPEGPEGMGPMPMLGFGCKAPVPPCGIAPEAGEHFGPSRPDFGGNAPEMNGPFHGPRPYFCDPAPEAGEHFGAYCPGFGDNAPEMNGPFHGPRPDFCDPAPFGPVPGPKGPAPETNENFSATHPDFDGHVPMMQDPAHGPRPGFNGPAAPEAPESEAKTEAALPEESAPDAPQAENPDTGIMTLEEVAPEDRPAE